MWMVGNENKCKVIYEEVRSERKERSSNVNRKNYYTGTMRVRKVRLDPVQTCVRLTRRLVDTDHVWLIQQLYITILKPLVHISTKKSYSPVDRPTDLLPYPTISLYSSPYPFMKNYTLVKEN